MKRLFSGLMALVLTATLAAGCSAQQEPPSGIFYDVTGIAPKSVACKVGDVEFPTELYLYWIAYGCSSMEYNLSMYHAYGLYEEMFDEDGNVLWDADFMDGMTLAEQVKEQAEENIRFYAAMESKAKALGVELTEEDQAELEENYASTVAQMGGEEVFQENLDMMGISRESFDRISEDAILFNKLLALVSEEGSALYVSPEEYEQDVFYTDHILLGTTGQESSEPLSEEEIAEKRATAEQLLIMLQSAEDDEREALFDQLVEAYGEDPGRAAAKGYVVMEDSNFVPEFLEAALALQPGELSDIVESTYGYHILYRRSLADMMEEFPEQTASLAEDRLYELLGAEADTLEIESSEEISALNIAEFYTTYSAKVEELNAAKEAENSDGAGTGDGADTGDDAAAGDGGTEE